MNAKRNETPEREMAIEVNSKDLDKMMTDRRNGMQMGTLRQMCQQYGISVSANGGKSTLRAKRDGLQMTVEKLHFCRVGYSPLP